MYLAAVQRGVVATAVWPTGRGGVLFHHPGFTMPWPVLPVPPAPAPPAPVPPAPSKATAASSPVSRRMRRKKILETFVTRPHPGDAVHAFLRNVSGSKAVRGMLAHNALFWTTTIALDAHLHALVEQTAHECRPFDLQVLRAVHVLMEFPATQSAGRVLRQAELVGCRLRNAFGAAIAPVPSTEMWGLLTPLQVCAGKDSVNEDTCVGLLACVRWIYLSRSARVELALRAVRGKASPGFHGPYRFVDAVTEHRAFFHRLAADPDRAARVHACVTHTPALGWLRHGLYERIQDEFRDTDPVLERVGEIFWNAAADDDLHTFFRTEVLPHTPRCIVGLLPLLVMPDLQAQYTPSKHMPGPDLTRVRNMALGIYLTVHFFLAEAARTVACAETGAA